MGSYALIALGEREASAAGLRSLVALCGFETRTVMRFDDAASELQQRPPEMIILNATGSGTTAFCRQLRALSSAPIIAICPPRSEELVVELLEAGADSVICEPLTRRTLAARIDALLRQNASPRNRPHGGVFRVDGLTIDVDKHDARLCDRPLSLTPIEFRLLVALVRQAGNVVPHPTLIAEIWGRHDAERADNLRVHVRYLRRKLAGHRQHSILVKNHRGIGYMLAVANKPGKEKQVLAYG